MLIAAIICGVAAVVIGVPFTYYWLRLSDRWADEDQKRFHPPADRRDESADVRVIRDPDGER